MKWIYFLLIGLSFCQFSATTPFAEICDNTLDDDADGLIDLNDPDCDCPLATPLSLIPNPSFEEQECCPTDRSQMDCATGWIQASEATTDYLHVCGWMGWDELPPPLPFPDGNGCMGFRNGRPGGPFGGGPGGNNQPNPNWKEYAGACLLNPMKAGVSYRFEFWIGFTYAQNSPPTSIVFYGSTDCINLPFGLGNEAFGCPINGTGWIELGSVQISGARQWILKEITVTPTVDIYAIAIGPNCVEVPAEVSLYYFFDNLVLAETKHFEEKITASAHPCSSQVSLEFPDRDTLQYQWYLDGVALPGQTKHELQSIQKEGNYQVRVLGPNSCKISKPFEFKIPVYFGYTRQVICKDETYFFHQENLDQEGIYFDTLKNREGCDSIVRLELEVSAESTDTVYAKIFETESWQVGSQHFSKPGKYDVTLKSWIGCDSMVHLILEKYGVFVPNAFSPNFDGVNDIFTVLGGVELKAITRLRIFDRWGGLIFEAKSQEIEGFFAGWDGTSKGNLSLPGVYVYQARIRLDDGVEREIMGEVTLVK